MTHQGAACNMASIHFGWMIRRTNIVDRDMICLCFHDKIDPSGQGYKSLSKQ